MRGRPLDGRERLVPGESNQRREVSGPGNGHCGRNAVINGFYLCRAGYRCTALNAFLHRGTESASILYDLTKQ
jgi:hypothetical protein